MSQTSTTNNETAATERPTYLTPRADIRGGSDWTEVHLDLPGVATDGVEITVENQLLTLIGRRKAFDVSGEYLHQEIRRHDYRRVFEISPKIDTNRIQAEFREGVLLLRLPIAESVKPRRITVD